MKESGLSSGVDESGGESAKTLKIVQALIGELFKKAIEVGHTVFQNCETMAVHFRLTVKIKHRTSADDRIQRHQLPFIRAGKSRPAFAAVFVPEGGDGLMTHMMVPSLM